MSAQRTAESGSLIRESVKRVLAVEVVLIGIAGSEVVASIEVVGSVSRPLHPVRVTVAIGVSARCLAIAGVATNSKAAAAPINVKLVMASFSNAMSAIAASELSIIC
jgi:hypothetical protein